MAHSVPDNVAVVIETRRRARAAHQRLEARPHAGRRLPHRRRQARGARQPRRRPAARATRRTPSGGGFTGLGAARRRGVPPDHPPAAGPRPHRLLRLERPPDAAGDRRRRPDRPQGRGRRPLDAQEPEHRRQPRLPGGAGGDADPPAGARGVRPARGADPLHRKPGRADVGPDPDRVPRPPVGLGRARRHGDHLRAARAGERAARARHDQPALEGGRGGLARGERGRTRLGTREPGGDQDALRARASQGGDADPRRVPDAGGECADGAGGGRAGGRDRHRRERLGRRAEPERASGSSTRSRPV